MASLGFDVNFQGKRLNFMPGTQESRKESKRDVRFDAKREEGAVQESGERDAPKPGPVPMLPDVWKYVYMSLVCVAIVDVLAWPLDVPSRLDRLAACVACGVLVATDVAWQQDVGVAVCCTIPSADWAPEASVRVGTLVGPGIVCVRRIRDRGFPVLPNSS